jgi:hypothetical protein
MNQPRGEDWAILVLESSQLSRESPSMLNELCLLLERIFVGVTLVVYITNAAFFALILVSANIPSPYHT